LTHAGDEVACAAYVAHVRLLVAWDNVDAPVTCMEIWPDAHAQLLQPGDCGCALHRRVSSGLGHEAACLAMQRGWKDACILSMPEPVG